MEAKLSLKWSHLKLSAKRQFTVIFPSEHKQLTHDDANSCTQRFSVSHIYMYVYIHTYIHTYAIHTCAYI